MSGRLPAIANRPDNQKENMSNAQPDTRGAGGERRRNRSRGGRGRNRSRQNDDSPEGNQNRGERGERGDRGERRSHGEHRGDRGERQPRTDRDERGPRPPRKEYKPAPLTLWQKILKIFGIKPKEPVRPPRPERKESVRFEEGPPREVKSNTRNARQPGVEGAPPQQREERPERRDRQERPDRQERGERPDRGERGERRQHERGEVASARIYLGNLSYESSEEDLKDLFKGIGTVRNVEIVYNRRTHKSKGYGFVDMLNTEEAKRSVEVLHDQFFMGRKLVVSGAKSKEHEDAVREEMPEPRAAQVAAPAPAPVAEEVTTPIFEEPALVENEAPVVENEAPVEVAEHAPAPENDEHKA